MENQRKEKREDVEEEDASSCLSDWLYKHTITVNVLRIDGHT